MRSYYALKSAFSESAALVAAAVLLIFRLQRFSAAWLWICDLLCEHRLAAWGFCHGASVGIFTMGGGLFCERWQPEGWPPALGGHCLGVVASSALLRRQPLRQPHSDRSAAQGTVVFMG